jgi:hypothetical protein
LVVLNKASTPVHVPLDKVAVVTYPEVDNPDSNPSVICPQLNKLVKKAKKNNFVFIIFKNNF